MGYDIRPVRFHYSILFSLVILWNVLDDYYGQSFIIFVLVLIIWIGFASLRFKITIHDDLFTYQLSFLKLSLRTKNIYPEEVKEIKFFRIPWAKKAAIVKLNKGMSIRLAVMEHTKAYEHLLEFAESHEIAIRKTKDYLILEKMK